MARSVDQHIPGLEPGAERPPEKLEASPEQESEIERLVEQGVTNYEGARAAVLGGQLVMEAEATKPNSARRQPEGKTARPTGSRRKMSPRERAWGEQTPAEDGTYNPLN